MGLSMISCLSIGIFLFPFFFMKWHPYIPLHFREMIIPLVAIPTNSHYAGKTITYIMFISPSFQLMKILEEQLKHRKIKSLSICHQ